MGGPQGQNFAQFFLRGRFKTKYVNVIECEICEVSETEHTKAAKSHIVAVKSISFQTLTKSCKVS